MKRTTGGRLLHPSRHETAQAALRSHSRFHGMDLPDDLGAQITILSYPFELHWCLRACLLLYSYQESFAAAISAQITPALGSTQAVRLNSKSRSDQFRHSRTPKGVFQFSNGQPRSS